MRYYGEIMLNKIKEAIKLKPDALGEYKGEPELKVDAKMWDDKSVSISVYKDGERVTIGRLKLSKFNDIDNLNQATNPVDLPF